MNNMQKIATKVFICASVMFGITGIALALFGQESDNAMPNFILMRLLMTTVFIILPSFALSIAGKYLGK